MKLALIALALAQDGAQVLLEKARQKAGVEHDAAAAVELYRQVIESHRNDLKYSRPALKELLALRDKTNGKVSERISALARTYLADPGASISEETLTRDLLIKPWRATFEVKDLSTAQTVKLIGEHYKTTLPYTLEDRSWWSEVPLADILGLDRLPKNEQERIRRLLSEVKATPEQIRAQYADFAEDDLSSFALIEPPMFGLY